MRRVRGRAVIRERGTGREGYATRRGKSTCCQLGKGLAQFGKLKEVSIDEIMKEMRGERV